MVSLRPLFIRPGDPPAFPDPHAADGDGLVAVGGDLRPQRLLLAYDLGIFPWYDAEIPLWWSPDPRAVMTLERLHVSRSFRRFFRKTPWRVTCDQAFSAVMVECSRERADGTWIHTEVIQAYTELHRRGFAHSFEVWDGERLIGGLYGVHRGGLFAAESMFHRRTNASKVALCTAVASLFPLGIELFDVQFVTDHLESLGAFELSRQEYLARLRAALPRAVPLARLARQDPLELARAELERRRAASPLGSPQAAN